MKDKNILWFEKNLLERAAKSLEKNNFGVKITNTIEEARNLILEKINPEQSIGVGGSMTVEQIGIVPELLKRGVKVISHTFGKTPEERLALRRQAILADVYLASPNSITLDGKLLFIDHYGNRPTGVTFGPAKVILVAGINKISWNEESGWWRAKNVAAVINARRLGLKTPCVTTGYCSDCDSPERICRVFLKLEKKPKATEYLVVLVNDELGY